MAESAPIQTQLRISIASKNVQRRTLPIITCDSMDEYHTCSTELFDAVTKACLEQDPKSKAALEADTTDRTVIPHITIETEANIDVAEVMRAVYAKHKRRLERYASTDIDED